VCLLGAPPTGGTHSVSQTHGVIAVFLYPLHSNYSFRPRFIVPRARGCHALHALFFLKALSGLSKQGQVFRNSYVTGHLCHEIATSYMAEKAASVFIDGTQSS
jgi:hypothetical protein